MNRHRIKVTGSRSVASKLNRLACELLDDAGRLRADYDSEHEKLANSLADIGAALSALCRSIDSTEG